MATVRREMVVRPSGSVGPRPRDPDVCVEVSAVGSDWVGENMYR